MDNHPQTTVIIPTYNRPHLIGRAIKSVLNQTYQDFEIVIIDSSPDDKTGKAVNAFNESRIKYIHNKERTSLSIAKNQGIKASSRASKYIAFLDDDDEFLPQFLEKTVKVLEEKKDVSMVTSYWETRTRDGKKLGNDKCPDNFWEISAGSGWVMRKEIFTKENLWYDEKLEFMEDADFGIRVLSNHKWESIAEVARIYYIIPLPNESTLSGNMSASVVELFYRKEHSEYRRLGKKALGYFYFTMGKIFMRTEARKRGRKELLKAFLTYPRPAYLFYYFLSLLDLFFPNLFRNVYLRRWKQKILHTKFFKSNFLL